MADVSTNLTTVSSHRFPTLSRRLLKIFGGMLPILVVAGVWEAVSQAGAVNRLLLPPLTEVMAELGRLTTNGELLEALWTTSYRAAAGVGMALVAGVVVGMLMARSRIAEWFFEPVVAIGFPMPTITLLPVFILWFGPTDASKIFLIALTCFFPIAISTRQGAREVNAHLVWSAQAMGSRGVRLFRTVILPAAMPFVFTGIRVAVPLAVIVTFVTEMIGGGGGLGYMLIYGYRFLQTPTVLAALITVLLFGFVLDRLVLAAHRALVPWEDHKADTAHG